MPDEEMHIKKIQIEIYSSLLNDVKYIYMV